MPEPPEPMADGSLARLRRLVAACERFEAALRAGGAPRVEDFLAEAPTIEQETLRGELDAIAASYAAAPLRGVPRPADPDATTEPVDRVAARGADATTRTTPPGPATARLQEAAGPLTAGATLGPYALDEPIGHGGMSVVYRAFDARLARAVAVKVLRLSAHAPGESIERFQVEMRALGRLGHDRVVPIYDVGEDRGRHFLVMRYFPDGSLAERLREAPLPDRPAAALLAKVARTVDDLHARRVIHRDLKPSNILLDGRGEPHVGDFGLAKILGDDPELTRAAALLGTPSYMAPEQAADPAGAREAADIYSLGATLYRAVTGRPPFQAADPVETLRQVRDEEPQPPRGLNPAIARDLETICLKCLEKDPRRRFATAGELAAELERFARGEPIRTRPLARRERLARWAARHRLVAALLGLALASTVVSLVALTLLWRFAEASRRRLERDGYFQRVALAARALEANRTDQAGRLLDGCPEALRGWEWRLLRRLRDAAPAVLPGDGPDPSLWSVAWSPDGSALACAGRRGQAQLWRAGAWRRLPGALPGASAAVDLLDLAWVAPGGRPEGLAAACSDGAVRRWERTGDAWRARPPGTRHAGLVRCLAGDARAGRLISGGDDGRVVAWEADDGRPAELAQLGRPIWDVALAPDGRTYAATGEDRWVWLGRVGAGAPRVLARLAATGTALAFAPDGRHLAVASGDGSIRVHDLRRGAVRRLDGHLDHVGGLAWSPDGRHLASAGQDGLIKLWDAADGREALSLRAARPVEALAFSPDGRYLAACDDEETTVYDAAPAPPVAPTPHAVLRGHAGTVVALAIAPGGRLLASSGNDGMVRLWDVARGTSEALVDPEAPAAEVPPKVNAVAFGAGGTLLAAGGRDDRVRLWDVRSRAVVGRLDGPSRIIGALAFGPGGRSLACADGAGAVLSWEDAAAGGVPRALGRQPDEAYALAVQPGGALVATAGADGAVWLWDRRGGPEPAGRLDGHDGYINGLAFSPDGRLLASAGSDQTAIVWDVAARAARHHLKAHASRVWDVAFSPDGATLATAGGDWVVRLWDVATGRRRRELRGHAAHACAVAFSPDGRFLASGGGDRTVRLWPAAAWASPAE